MITDDQIAALNPETAALCGRAGCLGRGVCTQDDRPHPQPLHGDPSVTTIDRITALRELHALVGTYLEGSADAPRAAELIAALEDHPETSNERRIREERECAMFGTTAARLDQVLAGASPRDIAVYARDMLSSALKLIRSEEHEGNVEWSIADRHAGTIRQLINVARYAVDKAVPR